MLWAAPPPPAAIFLGPASTPGLARPIMCQIRHEDGGGVTRVDVYDDIGPGDWFSEGLTAKAFADQLAA